VDILRQDRDGSHAVKTALMIVVIALALSLSGCICCCGIDGFFSNTKKPLSEVATPGSLTTGGTCYMPVYEISYNDSQQIKQAMSELSGEDTGMSGIAPAIVDYSGLQGMRLILYMEDTPEARLFLKLSENSSGLSGMPGFDGRPVDNATLEQFVNESETGRGDAAFNGSDDSQLPYVAVMLFQISSPVGASASYEAMKQLLKGEREYEGSVPIGDAADRYYSPGDGQHTLISKYGTVLMVVMSDKADTGLAVATAAIEAVKAANR
jgi:hypothetical protein